MSDGIRRGPPPLPDDHDDDGIDDDGIQADAPRPKPRRAPEPADDLIILSEESAPPTPAKRRKPAVPRATHLHDEEFAIRLRRPTFALVVSLAAFPSMAIISGLVTRSILWFLLFGMLYFGLTVVAVVVYFTRPRRRTLRITAEGIELTRPDESLAYDEILEIYAPDRKRSRGQNFPIHLLHAHGYVTIPPSVDADSAELADFLQSQPLGVRTVPKVPAVLRDFVKQQTTIHGAEAIYVYRARLTQPLLSIVTTVWIALTLAAVGVGLAALGIIERSEPLIVCGLALAGVMGLVCLLCAVQRWLVRPPIKDWQNSMLVIAPDGLALVQGPLEGELRWHELTKVKFGKGVVGASSGAAHNAAVPGIVLHVTGAMIVIADLYHWPLTHALEQIERYRDED